MGELILAKTSIAARSYFLEEASLNIYSLEELSYYIHTNAFVLGENIINESLCEWISVELGQEQLGKELLSLMSSNASTNVLVGHMLRHTGYLTREEIRRTLDVISSFEGKTPAQVEKIRADYLMEKKRYTEAVRSYESILDRGLEMDDQLKGNITHNLACALCRLFLFKRAIGFYESAYRLNRNEESLMRMLYACLFDNDEARFLTLCERYHVLPEYADKLKNDYESALNSQDNTEFRLDLEKKTGPGASPLERENRFLEIVDAYTADYLALRT